MCVGTKRFDPARYEMDNSELLVLYSLFCSVLRSVDFRCGYFLSFREMNFFKKRKRSAFY